jgi:hypothetical protein
VTIYPLEKDLTRDNVNKKHNVRTFAQFLVYYPVILSFAQADYNSQIVSLSCSQNSSEAAAAIVLLLSTG